MELVATCSALVMSVLILSTQRREDVLAPLGGQDQHRHDQGAAGGDELHPGEGRRVERAPAEAWPDQVGQDPADDEEQKQAEEGGSADQGGPVIDHALQPGRGAFVIQVDLADGGDRVVDMGFQPFGVIRHPHLRERNAQTAEMAPRPDPSPCEGVRDMQPADSSGRRP